MGDTSRRRDRSWWVWPSVFTPALIAWNVLGLAWYWAMATIAGAIVLLEIAEGERARRRTPVDR